MKKYYFIGAIIIIYILFFLFISPLHEFSTMDAWVHGLAVRNFLNTHQIQVPDLCPGSLIFQILWGAFFCLIVGKFSYGMLNLSTFIMSIIGAISFYLILRRLRFREILCIFGTLCLIINPLYFFLSFTFMLDVPCLSLLLLSLLFYLKGLDDDNSVFLFIGSVVSVMSFFIKQYGIILPFSLALYMLLKDKLLFKKRIIHTCLIPFFAFVAYLIWYVCFHLPRSLTKFYFSPSQSSFNWYAFSVYKDIPREFIILLLYGGLFITPLLLGALLATKDIFKKRNVLAIAAFSLVIIAGGTYVLFIGIKPNYFSLAKFMPYAAAIIHKWGLGPVTIVGDKTAFLSLHSWMIITVISILSATAIFVVGVVRPFVFFRYGKRHIVYIYGLLSLLFMLLFLPLYGDHNFIYLLPVVILLALELLEQIDVNKILLILGLLVLGSYSVLGTKDYMNWNEARLSLSNYLLSNNVQPNKIANGYEWGEFIFSQRAIDKLNNEFQKCPKDRWTISKWIIYIEPKYDPQYVISFSPSLRKHCYIDRLSSGETVSGIRSEHNFFTYKKEYYYNALKFIKEPIYILKRQEE